MKNKEYINRALQYVKNTGGGATVANFMEDHEPIGDALWSDLTDHGFVKIADERIYLTDSGIQQLSE